MERYGRSWAMTYASSPGVSGVTSAIVGSIPVLIVITIAIIHAVRTRREWNAAVEVREENVRRLLGANQTYHGIWGLDTNRVVRRISRLRGEARAPRISPHFVIAITQAGLWIVHGSRGDQGVTVVNRAEFISLSTASSGAGAYTAWYIRCEVRGTQLRLPIRVTHPSSDFLTADYTWAKAQGESIVALLTTDNAEGRPTP